MHTHINVGTHTYTVTHVFAYAPGRLERSDSKCGEKSASFSTSNLTSQGVCVIVPLGWP